MISLTIINKCVYINVMEQYEVDITRGISVVFGCHHCSNTWIATISIYLVAGHLFISATGRFNGIAFYAKAANVGILDMLKIHY